MRGGIRGKLYGGRGRGADAEILQHSASAGGCSQRLGHDFLLRAVAEVRVSRVVMQPPPGAALHASRQSDVHLIVTRAQLHQSCIRHLMTRGEYLPACAHWMDARQAAPSQAVSSSAI